MSVYDRGTQKWTSIMLPEHVEMLENLMHEEELKEKPIIDEQIMAEYYLMLQEAVECDTKVRIQYYVNHNYVVEEGYLLSIDGVNGIIYMEKVEIMFDDIIQVNIF